MVFSFGDTPINDNYIFVAAFSVQAGKQVKTKKLRRIWLTLNINYM